MRVHVMLMFALGWDSMEVVYEHRSNVYALSFLVRSDFEKVLAVVH